MKITEPVDAVVARERERLQKEVEQVEAGKEIIRQAIAGLTQAHREKLDYLARRVLGEVTDVTCGCHIVDFDRGEPADIGSALSISLRAGQIVSTREKFVAEYCRSKGWANEAEHLTVQQILEIREQDGWKNACKQRPMAGVTWLPVRTYIPFGDAEPIGITSVFVACEQHAPIVQAFKDFKEGTDDLATES